MSEQQDDAEFIAELPPGVCLLMPNGNRVPLGFEHRRVLVTYPEKVNENEFQRWAEVFWQRIKPREATNEPDAQKRREPGTPE